MEQAYKRPLVEPGVTQFILLAPYTTLRCITNVINIVITIVIIITNVINIKCVSLWILSIIKKNYGSLFLSISLRNFEKENENLLCRLQQSPIV